MTGTQTTLYLDWSGPAPVEGDILRTDPGGSCYLIDALAELAPRRAERRYRARCTRLGKDAAPAEADGVWLIRRDSRRRRR